MGLHQLQQRGSCAPQLGALGALRRGLDRAFDDRHCVQRLAEALQGGEGHADLPLAGVGPVVASAQRVRRGQLGGLPSVGLEPRQRGGGLGLAHLRGDLGQVGQRAVIVGQGSLVQHGQAGAAALPAGQQAPGPLPRLDAPLQPGQGAGELRGVVVK